MNGNEAPDAVATRPKDAAIPSSGRQSGAHLHDEHDGISPHQPGVQFPHRARHPGDQLTEPEGHNACRTLADGTSDEYAPGGHQDSPSASGPRASTGRKVSAATNRMTPTNSATNCSR